MTGETDETADLGPWTPSDSDELVGEYGNANVEIWESDDVVFAIDTEHEHLIYKARTNEQEKKLRINTEGYVDGKLTEKPDYPNEEENQ